MFWLMILGIGVGLAFWKIWRMTVGLRRLPEAVRRAPGTAVIWQSRVPLAATVDPLIRRWDQVVALTMGLLLATPLLLLALIIPAGSLTARALSLCGAAWAGVAMVAFFPLAGLVFEARLGVEHALTAEGIAYLGMIRRWSSVGHYVLHPERHAIALYARAAPELLLLELHLPDTAGYELAVQSVERHLRTVDTAARDLAAYLGTTAAPPAWYQRREGLPRALGLYAGLVALVGVIGLVVTYQSARSALTEDLMSDYNLVFGAGYYLTAVLYLPSSFSTQILKDKLLPL